IAHCEPPTGLEEPESLTQHHRLLDSEVDHTVGNNDIHCLVFKWDVFDASLEEGDVFRAGLSLVLLREGKHFVGHINTVGVAGGADPARTEQDINSAPATEIQHDFALMQFRQGGRVTASEGAG